ncbi:MAG: rhodanese-like domain-containing protein [Coriobacteriales bacterium]|nr:rhodanese-like domain-containing protein [Coriobacteriales bacterium]
MKHAMAVACLVAGVLCGCAPATSGQVQAESSAVVKEADMQVDMAYVEAHLNDSKLIDVRTPGEFEQGHIEGAINIDSATFDVEQVSGAGIGTDDPIIIYCRTGRRADGVARALADAGYTQIKVYKPGYPEWAASH